MNINSPLRIASSNGSVGLDSLNPINANKISYFVTSGYPHVQYIT